MAIMWAGAEGYDQLMGRWSRRMAPLFIEFAGVHDGDRVLDVGCGTGSLTRALVEDTKRLEVVGVDPTSPYIEYARGQFSDARVRLEVVDAQDLPYPDRTFDKCLSLLVLNFVPDAHKAVTEMYRVTRQRGGVAAAVWDYGAGMEMLRIMWDTAVVLDPAVSPRHERNMSYCRKGELSSLWTEIGFQDIEETFLSISQEFSSFEDYWLPFLTGVGPSGSYVSALAPEHQQLLHDSLQGALLGARGDRPFSLQASAWAVRGNTPKV